MTLPESFDEGKWRLPRPSRPAKRHWPFLSAAVRSGSFPGGHGQCNRNAIRSTDGPQVAQLYRPDGEKVASRRCADLLRWPQQPAVPDGWPSAQQSAARLADPRVPGPVDAPLRLAIGRPIARNRLNQRAQDTKTMMDFLRQETYALSPTPLESLGYGFEFDEKYRT